MRIFSYFKAYMKIFPVIFAWNKFSSMAESDNNSLSELAQILWTNKVQISKILDLWLNKFLFRSCMLGH